MATIAGDDLVASIAEALQFISSNHPPDYIENLVAAWRHEESPAARDAIGQILVNSRMAPLFLWPAEIGVGGPGGRSVEIVSSGSP